MDVILAKVSTIKRCLRRIKDVTNLSPDSLDDEDKQDIFILNLQRAVEAAIDIATHIVASDGLGVPSTTKENFELLREAGAIDDNLLKKMQSMVGFRNIAIHDYQSIDVDILKSILTKNLKDLEEFYTVVIETYPEGKRRRQED